jgi:hypothetical protein
MNTTHSLYLRNSVITCTAPSSSSWIYEPTNGTLDAGTSTIKINGNNATFYGSNTKSVVVNYYNLEINAGKVYIRDSNTFNNVKINAGNIVVFEANKIQIINSLTANGGIGSLITMQSTTLGTQYTISDSEGTNLISYCNVTDCIATGGALFNTQNSTLTNCIGWDIPSFRCRNSPEIKITLLKKTIIDTL